MTTKVIEIKNVIEKDYQKKLYNLVTNIEFPWHYMEDTTYEVKNPADRTTPAFGHLLYNNGDKSIYADEFTPLLLTAIDQCGLKLKQLIRMRLGFLLNTVYPLPSVHYKHNSPHVDYNGEHYTMCYYLNTCDGETIVFNEQEESAKYSLKFKTLPEQGKIICFNGKYYHASTCPKIEKKRIVLTINFTADPL